MDINQWVRLSTSTPSSRRRNGIVVASMAWNLDAVEQAWAAQHLISTQAKEDKARYDAALKAAGVLTKAEKKAQGPKRPLSAYMHFCAERRPSLTEELKAQLGADASIAVGPVGAGVQAATTDMLQFTRGKGVFGGLTVEGAVIAVRSELNEEYYGKQVRPVDILVQRSVSRPGADPLRAAVRKAAHAG